MAEWQNGGMAEWQKGGMAEWYFTTYLIYPAIFMVHADDEDDDDDDTDTFKSFIVLIVGCDAPCLPFIVCKP
jgi:hypothetical protein